MTVPSTDDSVRHEAAPTRARAALSTALDAACAGAEATAAAVAGLGGAAPDLCVVFAAAGYDQEALLRAVRAGCPAATVVGCSGEGVVSEAASDEGERAVVVLAVASERMRFRSYLERDYGEDPTGSADRLAARIAADGVAGAVGVVLFPDGLVGNCAAFLDRLQASLPEGLPIIGGTSGDAMQFTRTFQYAGDEVVHGGVAALVILGDADVLVRSSHGCVPIGLERTITEARDGWVYRIDGRPAWSVFKEYLDGDPEDLNAEGIVHLCFGAPVAPELVDAYDPYIIRTPLRLDRENGALFFPGGGFVTGARVRLTRRDPRKIRASAERCALSIRDVVGGRTPAFVLQFDCAGRGRILFGDLAATHVVTPLQDTLGAAQAWAGFHSYGEIAPVGPRLEYHNYTVALCAVYDR